MDPISVVLLVLLVLAVGASVYFWTQNQAAEKAVEDAKNVGKLSEMEAIEKASAIAKKKILEAEEEASKVIKKSQSSAEEIRKKLAEQERTNSEREKKLLERSNNLDNKFDKLEQKETEIEVNRKKVKEIRERLSTELEKIASLTKDEAQNKLMEAAEAELQDWMAKKIKEKEQKIKHNSDEIAQDILTEAMANAAVDYVADTTMTTMPIEDENLISRIIGKNGRNIRTLQNLTGADVIVEESPNEVTISCFDPIRREVAALTLKQLMKSGKISPVTIEETVEKVKKAILKEIKETGEMMAYESGFNDLPEEIIMLLGRFKYRFSYGQNLVKHTLEMVKISEALARELHADVRTSKLAALLHDIGKVAPEEGKQHHHISAELARKYYKDDERLVNAIEAHHFDIDAKYVEAEIIRIADSISGSRPGARRDSYEEYIKRIRALEDIANQKKGVKETYALQSGREIRVIVKSNEVDDAGAKVMAHDIAKEIENTQSYPGQVNVTVIREVREKATAA